MYIAYLKKINSIIVIITDIQRTKLTPLWVSICNLKIMFISHLFYVI